MPPEPENDWGVEWCEEIHEYHLKLFMSLFPADHNVWQFIDIVTDDDDEGPTIDEIRRFKQGLAPKEQP